MDPTEGVLALIRARHRIERLEVELEQAKAERKELEETILPPLFLQAKLRRLDLSNGARATKSPFVYARLARPGDPRRQPMLDWLTEVGEADAIKATITAQWSKGDYEQAKQAYVMLTRDESARVTLDEDVHWATLQNIILDKVTSGHAVPLTAIGATFGDHVTIQRFPKDSTLLGDKV